MSKYFGISEPPPFQSAKANRQRLASQGRPAILEEIDRNASDVRTNMERLRQLRLAKAAQALARRES